MVRYTKEDIETLAKNVNEELKGTDFKVKIGYRYNYQAIDLYKKGKMQRTLIAGLTKNETWDYLHAFMKGIYYSHGAKYPSRIIPSRHARKR